MRRIAGPHPGAAQTDARDAVLVTEADRTMPCTLPSIRVDGIQVAELAVPTGFQDDFAARITATSNCLRVMLTPIHPAWSGFWVRG